MCEISQQWTLWNKNKVENAVPLQVNPVKEGKCSGPTAPGMLSVLRQF